MPTGPASPVAVTTVTPVANRDEHVAEAGRGDLDVTLPLTGLHDRQVCHGAG